MKVVFLARWYPHKYDPMFGLFVQRHAEAAALYDDITVIYVHPDEHAQNKYDIERTKENGVDTIRIYYKKQGKISSAWRYFRACMKGLKMAGKADLIHVHVLTRMGFIAHWQKNIVVSSLKNRIHSLSYNKVEALLKKSAFGDLESLADNRHPMILIK